MPSMNVGQKINNIRRAIMHSLTQNIGSSNINKKIAWNDETIKNVLICRPNNRLGNQLLITPLVKEISEIFPNCKIDLFVRGSLAPIIFENYENIGRIIKLPKKPFKELFSYIKVWISLRKHHYDMVINVDSNSSSGRLSTKFTNARFKFFNDVDEDLQAQYEDYIHIAKFPVYNLRKYLNQLGLSIIEKPLPSLDLKLNTAEIIKGKEILDSIVSCKKKTICLYTFATRDKCYSEIWWADTYEKIKNEYEETYNILEVLPIENISQIGFKATSYYSKDIREMGALIANTELFIAADSGIMHLASSVKTTTVGLFSVTDINKYQPYNNDSIAINTNITTTDDLINEIKSILKKKDKIQLDHAI